MTYDVDIAARIRELTAGVSGIREKAMFGGLAFLVNGNMAVAASAGGGILVRVDPAEYDQLASSPSVDVAVMGSRRMRGWLRVAAADLDADALEMWVGRGLAYARSLPGKTDSS